MKNKVFIAKSLDGFIAGPNGELDWLQSIPNPDHIDMGFVDFMNSIDALIMGRNTFEMVASFDGPWPYDKHVFVLSNQLAEIPSKLQDKASIVKGELTSILETLRDKGYNDLYIDGGRTFQNFLAEDLIDELIITTIPVVLGGGIPLFGETPKQMDFRLKSSQVFLDTIVQDHYIRNRE